jgi:hypothetical protein
MPICLLLEQVWLFTEMSLSRPSFLISARGLETREWQFTAARGHKAMSHLYTPMPTTKLVRTPTPAERERERQREREKLLFSGGRRSGGLPTTISQTTKSIKCGAPTLPSS